MAMHSPQPALLRLLAWLSPGFPTGAYAYSHGLEWAVEAHDVHNGDTLSVWLTDTLSNGSGRNDAILLRHAEPVLSVAFSSDSKILASGSEDETIKLWDVATGKERATLRGHAIGIYSVAFSPNGNLLASGSHDATIKLWDVATGKLRATLNGHEFVARSVAFSPDGKTLATGSWDRTIKLWDVSK